MAHHNHQTIGNRRDLIGWKNSLPDFRRATMHFEAGLKGSRPARDRVTSSPSRRRRGSVILALATIALLLFPVLSASDDFHVCRLSMESLANPAQPLPRVAEIGHRLQGPDGIYCAACVWSSFENASPSGSVSPDPASDSLVTGIPSLPCPPAFQIFASRADRAPDRLSFHSFFHTTVPQKSCYIAVM